MFCSEETDTASEGAGEVENTNGGHSDSESEENGQASAKMPKVSQLVMQK